MTKAELEKEAEEYFKSICGDYNEEYEQTGKRHYFVGFDIKNGYLAGAEPREKHIEELETRCNELFFQVNEKIAKISELEAQIEKMKSQYDYAFNQLRESREIVCLMLSQYKNKKEIDYSTKECGEKLLRQGVYKYD